ncbi:MAG TPA: DUF3137 domain-containing protein [Mycobacteriales bacterium]|nr:DUF3137 domain-containing protein [Mycobacteriales bacterium]
MVGTVVVWIVIGLAVLLVIYFQRRLAKKRREAMAAWARSHGFTYSVEDNAYIDRFRSGPFGKGDRRRATNVITGVFDGRPMIAFDYSYDTESTDSKGNRTRTTHRFNVAAVNLPATLPDLQVARESFFSSIGRALGFHDIEFENGEFNKEFKVHAEDRKFAYDVIHPRMMEWLLHTPGPSWSIERADLMCWASGRAKPESIDGHLNYLNGVVQQIPRFVWDRPGAP